MRYSLELYFSTYGAILFVEKTTPLMFHATGKFSRLRRLRPSNLFDFYVAIDNLELAGLAL